MECPRTLIHHWGFILERAHTPISQKEYLSLKEAASLFGIGINKLREMTDHEYADCVLFVGRRRMIKRRRLIERLDNEVAV